MTGVNSKGHHFLNTAYGFEWGAVDVKRLCGDAKKGWVMLGISTAKYPDPIQIYVTRTGKVRIYSRNGEWKSPKKKSTSQRKTI